MVRIVDGEILQDDDPRLTARSTPSRNTGRQPPSTSTAGHEGGWWHRTPFKLRWDAGTPPVLGVQLPDAEIFGHLVAGQKLLIAAALGIFLGWKWLLLMAGLYVVFVVNQTPPAATAQPQGGAAAGQGGNSGLSQAQDFMKNYFSTDPTQPARGSSANAADGSKTTFKGKGNRLGSR